jgi:hypothetical protein
MNPDDITIPFPSPWFDGLEHARQEYLANPTSWGRDQLLWSVAVLHAKIESWRMSEIVKEIEEERGPKAPPT